MGLLVRLFPAELNPQIPTLPMKRETRVQLFAACVMQVVGKFGLLYVFPILPAITQEFFPQLTEAELGYKQGYLAGIFFLGNFFGNFIWVKVADSYGRKRAMIVSTFLFTSMIVMFGMSTSYEMALSLRFLWGMFNGLDTIIKTFVAEICEKKDVARGLSIMALANGVGRMLGPTTSAWLSKPAEKYPFLDVEILRRFPFLLPSLVCFLLAVVSICVAASLIEETLQRRHKCDDGMLEPFEERVSRFRMTSIPFICKQYAGNTRELLRERAVLSAVLNYNLFALINMQFEELIPLVMVTAPCYGGFCMNENSLGLITLTASIVQIPWALFAVPVIINTFGIRKCVRFLISAYAALLVCLSLWTRNSLVRNAFQSTQHSAGNANGTLSLLAALNGTESNRCTSCGSASLGVSQIPIAVWLLLLPLLIPFFLLRMGLFTSYTVGVSNASRREARAAVNGVSQSGASLMRLIGPIFSANIFAWSISLGASWPLDSTLVWSLGCLQLSLLFLCSFSYPAGIEQPRD